MAQDEDHPAFRLQADLARAREEARRLEQARQQQFQDELTPLAPLPRLQRAIWLMRHEQHQGPFGPSHPISPAYLDFVQQDAIDHVRKALEQIAHPCEQVQYIRTTLRDLASWRDHEDLAGQVRRRLEPLLEHLVGKLAGHVEALRKAALAAEADLIRTRQAIHDLEHVQAAGMPANTRHLARAALILTRHPELSSKHAFEDQAYRHQGEYGPLGEDPGSTIWRGVQRLGQQVLGATSLPVRYQRFDGFRRLVFDLIRGERP